MLYIADVLNAHYRVCSETHRKGLFSKNLDLSLYSLVYIHGEFMIAAVCRREHRENKSAHEKIRLINTQHKAYKFSRKYLCTYYLCCSTVDS